MRIGTLSDLRKPRRTRAAYVAPDLPTGGGGVTRTLDVAGPEIVTNGQFTSDIAGWTEASNAGGAISWNAGKLRTTNTSATARARQVTTVETGARYAFFGQCVAATVAGSVALGTSAGGTQYLTYTVNTAVAAKAGVAEFTASATAAHIQFSAPLAGSQDWDNATLRKLIPTSFTTGKVFTDDFSLKADGTLGVTPDGLLWREMAPQNADHVYPSISGGKMVIAASGSAKSAGYPYLDLGDGKATGIHCDIAWTGTGASVAMISMEPTGTLATVANILANSLHIVFSDTKVDITTYVGSTETTEAVNYAAPCVTDGRTYPDVGWFLDGTTLTIKLPGGSTIQRTDSKFAQVAGSVAIPEIFYGTGVSGTVAIGKVAVRLG